MLQRFDDMGGSPSISSHICRTDVMMWTMQNAAEEVEHTRQRPVIPRQTVASESEGADNEIALVRAPVPSHGAPAISDEQLGPSLLVELSNLPKLKVRLDLDMIIILKKRQQQKWTFERNLKAPELRITPERKEVLPTVKNVSVVVLNNDDIANLGSHFEKRKRSYQATADFEAG